MQLDILASGIFLFVLGVVNIALYVLIDLMFSLEDGE